MHPIKETPSISIIIATYRRSSFLIHVLERLCQQNLQPMEVFVVDASPLEEQIVPDILVRFPSWLNYVVFDEGPGNASAQRNNAIRRSNGDIILFLDDDVDFSDNMLEAYINAFNQTGADAIAGRISIPGKQLETKIPITKFAGMVHHPGAPNYITCDFSVETYVVCTANFAVQRGCLFNVGGFDEQIFGTIEDVDLGLRLTRNGYMVLHYPVPHIVHFMASNSGARSENYKLEWSLSNVFYFQFKNFPEKRQSILLWDTVWNYCRPSRLWLKPVTILERFRSIKKAYRTALERITKGPIYITERQL